MNTTSSAALRGVSLSLALALVAGCTGLETTVAGAMLGGGAGAVIGHQSGRLAEGALIGVLVGGAIGYAVGQAQTEQLASAPATNRVNHYRSVRGLQVKVTDVSVEPKRAHPGDDVDLDATVAIMAPDVDQQIIVKQSTGLYRGDELVGRIVEDTFKMTPGTHRISRRITLQDQFEPGRYTYVTHIKVSSEGDFAEATSEETFQVAS